MGKNADVPLPRIVDLRGNPGLFRGALRFRSTSSVPIMSPTHRVEREGHAHEKLEQFTVAVSGSLDMISYDNRDHMTFHLGRSYDGLHLPQLHWTMIGNFLSEAVCLLLALETHSDDDHLLGLREFELATGVAS